MRQKKVGLKKNLVMLYERTQLLNIQYAKEGGINVINTIASPFMAVGNLFSGWGGKKSAMDRDDSPDDNKGYGSMKKRGGKKGGNKLDAIGETNPFEKENQEENVEKEEDDEPAPTALQEVLGNIAAVPEKHGEKNSNCPRQHNC